MLLDQISGLPEWITKRMTVVGLSLMNKTGLIVYLNWGDILHRFRRSDGGSSEAIHYVLQQDDADDIKRGYIGFHWAFEGGCRLLQAPAKVHVNDIF